MVVSAGERPAMATRQNASESDMNDMNEKHEGGSPNWKLLLIPAAVILAKGAVHRRAMWEAAGPTDEAGRGHGRHRRFGGWDPEAADPAAVHLPPRMERMLDSWHTRAHEATGAHGGLVRARLRRQPSHRQPEHTGGADGEVTDPSWRAYRPNPGGEVQRLPTVKLPDDLLDLLRGPSTCYLATLMSDGSPQVTQTWVDTDGEHVVINSVQTT